VSNRQKAEIVNDNFGIRNFLGCYGEILPRDQFMPKGQVCPEFSIQPSGQVPIAITRKPLAVWSKK
jgi:hypothetical protein